MELGLLQTQADVDPERAFDEGETLSSDRSIQRDSSQGGTSDTRDEDVKTHSSPSSTTAARVVPTWTQNPFAVEQSYFTRPNRYFGPPTTWRSWTADDRLVVQSLDRIRAQDLSVHLINAYSLKRRAHSLATERRKIRLDRSRSVPREEKSDDDDSTTWSFAPSWSWTAWPMHPDQVPRQGDRVGEMYNEAASKTAISVQPSSVLEDAFIATITKQARDRWNSRKWEIHFPPRDMKVEKGMEQAHSEETSEHEDFNNDEVSISDSGSDAPMFTSQTPGVPLDDFGGDPSINDMNGKEGNTTTELEPTPLADDETARKLLLPSTRHVLSQLDNLLLGLHKARQAYAQPRNNRQGESDATETTDTESGGIVSEVRGRGRSRSRSRSRSSHMKRKRSESILSSTSSVSQKGTSKSRIPKARDWSDVMGMALLTGWSPEVVGRASERCARLFGQNMLFRTFHEGQTHSTEKSCFTEHLAAYFGTSSEDEEDAAEEAGARVAIRTSKSCHQCQKSHVRCEPVENRAGRGPCKRCLQHGQDCSGVTTKLAPVNGRRCPHIHCERHTIAFASPYHLQRHLNSVHLGDGFPSPISRMTSSEPELPSAELVCPIINCKRHEKEFSRASKLYNHIRKLHPEVDISKIKKLEASRRGEKRGKWSDERRSRSRSASRSASRGRQRGNYRATSDDSDEYVDD